MAPPAVPQTPDQGTAPTPQTNDNEREREREREDITPGKAKRLKEARALLEGFWPAVFSFSKPQPLKVGITAELIADVEARGLPFTLEMLKSSLALYTNRINYVRAVADGCQRKADRAKKAA
ncbi:hypothetical protein O4M18_004256 [Escherichia coli]|nr:hypothetical protein [Escherichia coli]MBS9195188.1 hypothetical protein [Escherichia coli]